MGIRIYVMIMIIISCLMTVEAYEDRDLLQKTASLEKLERTLKTDQTWVPYPDYLDRQGWDRLTLSIKSDLIKEGEEYLAYEWKVITLSDYMEFDKSGSREVMQQPLRDNQRAITALFIAELAEGEGRFLSQIMNGAWQACEMTTWVLSAHLKAFQTSTKLAVPDPEEFTIDLSAGNLGTFYAWVYYFLHEQMDEASPMIAQRLRQNLQERILDPFMERDDFWWQAFHRRKDERVNNWNPWCNFNVLMCNLLLEEDPKALATAVQRSMRSVDEFINYYHDDGACEEGPSYWGHAAGKMYDYLDLLDQATGGQVSIFDQPIIKEMGEYIAKTYVGDGWVVNFADASARTHGSAGLIYRYGKDVDSEMMMEFAAYLGGQESPYATIMSGDISRVLANLLIVSDLQAQQASLPKFAHAWYPETEVCYLKNEDGFFLAAKGGFNGESHNHNDVGSFSLYVDKTPFIIDVGVGTYTRQTFGSERYEIWTMQSDYHNVPMINGFAQKDGWDFRAADVSFDEVNRKFSLNIAGAYPRDAQIDHWIRSYQLGENQVTIEDHFRVNEAWAPNQLNFLTWAKPDITKPGEVNLVREDTAIRLVYDAGGFTPEVTLIKLDDPRLSRVWGNVVFRLSLHAKTTSETDKYSYRLVRIDE